MSDSALPRLLRLAEDLHLDALDLDEAVADTVDRHRSRINNGGTEAQIGFLLEQHGSSGAEQIIRDAATAL